MFIPAVLVVASFLVIPTAAALYHLILAIRSLWLAHPDRGHGGGGPHRFAIVIPAHDEERSLAETLASCGRLAYPRDRRQVFVIADNCSDRTAEIARAHGAICLERTNDQLRGKGHALEWAFERILPLAFDGFVVLDADCQIDPHALSAFSCEFESGILVAQSNNLASNPDSTPTSYLSALSNYIENELFYAPKSALGLAVFLRGTGMLFHRTILEKFPWRAFTVVEDAEYSIQLIRSGLRIKFLPDVRVLSPFPVDSNELHVQRERWVGGSLAYSRTRAWKLMWEGFARRQPLLFDAGWTLFIQVRSLLALWVFSSMVLTLGLTLVSSSRWSVLLASMACVNALSFVLYFGLGVVGLGLTQRRVGLILGLPSYASRMLVIALRGLFGNRHIRWETQPRQVSLSSKDASHA